MVMHGSRGLKHGEAVIRQMCLDGLGSIAAALYRDAAQVEADEPKLIKLLSTAGVQPA